MEGKEKMNFQNILIVIGLMTSIIIGWIVMIKFAFEFKLVAGVFVILMFLLWCWLIKWNIFTIKD